MTIRVLNNDLPLRKTVFLTGEGLLMYAAILLPTLLFFGGLGEQYPLQGLLIRTLVVFAVLQVAIYLKDLRNPKLVKTHLDFGLALITAIGVSFLILTPVYFCFPFLIPNYGVLIISPVFMVILVGTWRYVSIRALEENVLTDRVLILGVGKLSQAIINEPELLRNLDCTVAGVVTTNHETADWLPGSIPLLSYNERFLDTVQSHRIKKLVIAMDDRRGKLPIEELLRCKLHGIEIVDGVAFYEKLTGRLLVDKMHPSFVVYSDGFRKSHVTRFLKRLSDLIIAALGLLLTLPATIIITLAIKLDSEGPVIFRQKRCTERGEIFELLKFRSMVCDAEAACGHKWADENDCRVTRVGRILRKYHLDEIPQMWNVFRGNMSFVGPRPERPEFVKGLKEIIPYYMERHAVKPGITGWAQVSASYGASVPDALEKLKYDLFYVKHMSFFFDLKIISRTIKILLQEHGAR